MSKIAVNEITNEAGTGGPTLPNGVAGGLTLGGDLTLDTNGIYLGGTGSANYLDDYEEGTWTPTLTVQGSGSVTIDASKTVTKYIKIGSQVIATGNVDLSAVSSPAGYFEISLPFVTENTDRLRWAGSVICFNLASSNISDMMIYTGNNNPNMTFVLGDGTTQQLDSAQQLTANTELSFVFSYTTS